MIVCVSAVDVVSVFVFSGSSRFFRKSPTTVSMFGTNSTNDPFSDFTVSFRMNAMLLTSRDSLVCQKKGEIFIFGSRRTPMEPITNIFSINVSFATFPSKMYNFPLWMYRNAYDEPFAFQFSGNNSELGSFSANVRCKGIVKKRQKNYFGA